MKLSGPRGNGAFLGPRGYYDQSIDFVVFVSPSVSGLRKQWSPEIVELMERMWAQDPHARPTMTQVVEGLEAMMS